MHIPRCLNLGMSSMQCFSFLFFFLSRDSLHMALLKILTIDKIQAHLTYRGTSVALASLQGVPILTVRLLTKSASLVLVPGG